MACIKTVSARVQQLIKDGEAVSNEAAKARTKENLRFMKMKARCDQTDQSSDLAPSAIVNDVWHKHLLDTK